MKFFKLSILSAALLFGNISCKDFLDVKPGNSVDANSPISSITDAKNLLNGLNRQMLSSNYYGRNYILYGDVKAGLMTVYSQGRGLDALYSFNQTPTTNSFSGFWSTIYSCINQTNLILEKIAAAKINYPNINFNNVEGQALTTRAMLYFDLVKLYGNTYTQNKASLGVPLILSTAKYDIQPARNTVEEVYIQILKDLKEGQQLLTKSLSKDPGYFNYYGNLAIQSRVYLTMADYDNAYVAAKEIIDSKVYSLYENDKWTTSWSSMFGNESIYELAIYEGEADLGTASLGYYVMRRLGGQGGIFYASTDYINALNEDSKDVRHAIFGRDEKSATRMGAVYKYLGSTNTTNALPINSIGDKGSNNNTAVNIKVIRLSEIYLTAAEAALKKATPNTSEAATYLNAISKRSPNLPAYTSTSVNEDAILKEKKKEFYSEGLIYWDLLRLNKKITFDDAFGGLNITTRPQTIDRSFEKTILPIPLTEINANPTLKTQQNPGY